MIQIDVPDLHMASVELQLEKTKSSKLNSPEAKSELQNLISVGIPQVRALSHEDMQEDEELRRFTVAEAAKHTYHVVFLACSFNPSADERIVEAWLQVDLTSADDTIAVADPIAWSLDPVRAESRPSEVETSVKIGAG